MEKNNNFQDQFFHDSNFTYTKLLAPYFYLFLSFLMFIIGFTTFQSPFFYFDDFNRPSNGYTHFFNDYFMPQMFSLILISFGAWLALLSILFLKRIENTRFLLINFVLLLIPGWFIIIGYQRIVSESLFLCSATIFDLCSLQLIILSLPFLSMIIYASKVGGSKNLIFFLRKKLN